MDEFQTRLWTPAYESSFANLKIRIKGSEWSENFGASVTSDNKLWQIVFAK